MIFSLRTSLSRSLGGFDKCCMHLLFASVDKSVDEIFYGLIEITSPVGIDRRTQEFFTDCVSEGGFVSQFQDAAKKLVMGLSEIAEILTKGLICSY